MRPKSFREVARRAVLSVPKTVWSFLLIVPSLVVSGAVVGPLVALLLPESTGRVIFAWMAWWVGALVIFVILNVRLTRFYADNLGQWWRDSRALDEWLSGKSVKRMSGRATGIEKRPMVPYSLRGEHRVIWGRSLMYRGYPVDIEAYCVAKNGFATNEHHIGSARGGEYFTVCSLRTPLMLPRTVARPHRVPRFLARAIGLPDISVESNEFNERWRLTGVNPRIAHTLMNPRAVHALLDPHLEYTIVTMDEHHIRTVRRDFHLDPESVEAHFDALVAMARTAKMAASWVKKEDST